ncbi:MAG: HAMP domain-containing sensor histidine kinase [Ilumatobacteraceae bacterium]
MTLRLRLVAGLVVLLTIGLAIFGFSTYGVYSRTEHDRLDDQLRNAFPSVATELLRREGFAVPGIGTRGATAPAGTYAQLVDPNGTVVQDASVVLVGVQEADSIDRPALPVDLIGTDQKNRLFTTGSSIGSGEWRVLVTKVVVDEAGDAYRVVVASPTTDVTNSLHRFALIEALAAAGLLVILAVGSWFILRRGLRPLEQMATSTRSITAGALSQRVTPSDDRSEVGQLGLALNTMLDEIEVAFNEREATEFKLRQFLADASHELRTPLTSIQGFAELFRLGGDHPDFDLPLVMRRIEQESARMKVLVEDLLLLARLDEQRLGERTPVDVAVLAADACSDARATAPDRPVTLAAPEPVVVDGFADHLRQALANLVTNAIRHTPTGTSIEISARVIGVEAVIQVRDHGAGLDPNAAAHVFDRFWQADSARVGAGSGLGLAIVASIAAEHAGSASVANALDGGAVFTIRIPLALTAGGAFDAAMD